MRYGVIILAMHPLYRALFNDDPVFIKAVNTRYARSGLAAAHTLYIHMSAVLSVYKIFEFHFTVVLMTACGEKQPCFFPNNHACCR